MRLSDLGEFGLIERMKNIFARPGEKVIKGIGDDCAVVESSAGKVSLFTADILVESIHFKKDFISPENLGRKALAVNISDIAAMGGRPLYALISTAVPQSTEVEYIEEVISGINSIAAEFSISVVGGDTSLSPDRLIIDIFLMGEASKDKVLYRSGAEPDQIIFITGEVGSSAAGLNILKCGIEKEKFAELIKAHNLPRPHIMEGEIIAFSGLATSLIDVSDGVIADLGHICEESHVGAVVVRGKLPVADICKQYCHEYSLSAEDFALYGGEDYVLMGTAPVNTFRDLKKIMESRGASIFSIGRTTGESGIGLENEKGEIAAIEIKGHDHFKNRMIF